ncbi:MAG: hypothetical protein ABIQ31_04300 [Ferruginibacter sp.]
MKKKFTWSYRFTHTALILFLFLLLNSCSKKLQFLQSVAVPAADGSVKIKKDANKNYSIEIKVLHLAQPDQLQPSKSNYVIWLETNEHKTRNLGQLKSSSGFLSKALKASFSTVTSFDPKRIFITAEDAPDISYPTGETILTTKEF